MDGSAYTKSVTHPINNQALLTLDITDMNNADLMVDGGNSDGTLNFGATASSGKLNLFTNGDALRRYCMQGYISEVIVYPVRKTSDLPNMTTDRNNVYGAY